MTTNFQKILPIYFKIYTNFSLSLKKFTKKNETYKTRKITTSDFESKKLNLAASAIPVF